MNAPVISIVGCGMLGSHLAEELSKLCFSQDLFPLRFKFIDFDTWEERNAANQNVSLREAQSGAYKAETCIQYVESYVPFNTAEAVTEKLEPGNLAELLGESALIIDAVDNIPTRQLLWAFGMGRNIPVMHVGISRKGDGMINWSSGNFENFPYKPQNVAGRELQEQDFAEPPCTMYKYREAALVLVQAAAKAFAFFHGKDPWELLNGIEEEGMMTCWTTNPTSGAKLLVDDDVLVNEFFPVHQPAEAEEVDDGAQA
jgi:hypothetical protein